MMATVETVNQADVPTFCPRHRFSRDAPGFSRGEESSGKTPPLANRLDQQAIHRLANGIQIIIE